MLITKAVNGYPGYSVDEDGSVFSHKSNKYLRPGLSGDGYHTVALYKDGKRKTVKVHRLVASNYIVNNLNKPQVNHKDGNKLNNAVSNLEWVTGSENMHHACDNQLQPIGSKCHLAKLAEEDVVNIRLLLAMTFKTEDIAEMFDVSRSLIYQIKNEYCWKRA